jgi:hypothetical protein
MSFYEKNSLVHHFDVAHGKKPHQCPEFAKTFPHLAMFKTHVTAHVDRIMDRQGYGRTKAKDFYKKNSQMFSASLSLSNPN